MSDFTPGAFIEVAHPFVLEEYSGFDEDGPLKRMSWRPGVRFEMIGPEDSGSFADGIGKQVLTIISTHKPGRYPERVFYTRQWVSPDGHQFGKTKLRIITAAAFRTIIKGYRHRYEMPPCQLALQVAV
jgi:hypothetical protein